MWILLILLIILTLSQFWRIQNKNSPPWMKCKENLFVQTIFNKCTPSNSYQNKENLSLDDSQQ